MRRLASPCLAILLCSGACPAPALENWSASDPVDPPSDSTEGSSPAPPKEPTTSAGPDTTTGGLTTSSTGTTTADTTGDASTTGGPLPPPAILEHDLGPDPLKVPGPILVTITTAHADGVRMQVDDHPPIELAPAERDEFTGEIVITTALDNGPHHQASFIAWRDGLQSAPLLVPFTVDLPPPGTGLFWDADVTLGPGAIVALAVTPTHDLIELGTRYPMGQPRCYLRRRNLAGAWNQADVVDLLPDTACLATDLAVDAAGALHVLAKRLVNGEFRWWLGRIDHWGAAPTHVGTGIPGETAHALALDPARTVVCGTRPHAPGVEAVAWVFYPELPGKVLAFNYEGEGDPPKDTFSETPRDCVLTDNTLVLAGSVFGDHDVNMVERDRHFLLEIDLLTDEGVWHVAEPGPGTQSQARALAAGASGRYLTVGHFCDDVCQERAELRILLPDGEQFWRKNLDQAVRSPKAIVWSPAKYLVYAASRDEGMGTSSFFVEAWQPPVGIPLWSYARIDGPGMHTAHALAIGPYGQIYAGGETAGGYPALAIIAP